MMANTTLRTKTGIAGFDKLLEGGFPAGSAVLLSGTPGTGKTIFALEYLYHGCTKFNEKCAYISFEDKTKNLLEQAQQFGWDFTNLIKKKQIFFVEISSSDITRHSAEEIIALAKSQNIQRIVIDSLSSLAINTPSSLTKEGVPNQYSIMRFVYDFIDKLRSQTEATSLIISQTQDEKSLSKDSISEFLCDGVVHMLFESLGGDFSRSLIIRKMRRTKNDEDIHPVEITQKGIAIHTLKA
jgi:circadian clock protein KaiC